MDLDEDGSAVVELRGTTSAGNQVVIERDYAAPVDLDGDGEHDVAHTKLAVDPTRGWPRERSPRRARRP